MAREMRRAKTIQIFFWLNIDLLLKDKILL